MKYSMVEFRNYDQRPIFWTSFLKKEGAAYETFILCLSVHIITFEQFSRLSWNPVGRSIEWPRRNNFNHVVSNVPKGRRRCMQNWNHLTWDRNILYSGRSLKDEQHSIKPFFFWKRKIWTWRAVEGLNLYFDLCHNSRIEV